MTRVKRAFRARWLWALIVIVSWLLVAALTVTKLGPKPATAKDIAGGRYKFLYCDKCGTEMGYDKNLDGKPCPKCTNPKSRGFFMPQEYSIKEQGKMDPWMKVYVITFAETVIMLGILVYLMYRPVVDPATLYYVVSCPHCQQRLRYRSVSHGGLGSCSRCKRMLRFPDEEDAVNEEDVLKADAEAARIAAEQALDEADAEEQAGHQ
jgi:hypothetical protein